MFKSPFSIVGRNQDLTYNWPSFTTDTNCNESKQIKQSDCNTFAKFDKGCFPIGLLSPALSDCII